LFGDDFTPKLEPYQKSPSQVGDQDDDDHYSNENLITQASSPHTIKPEEDKPVENISNYTSLFSLNSDWKNVQPLKIFKTEFSREQTPTYNN
jgi:hypothetical protein